MSLLADNQNRTLIDELLAEQRSLTAVDRFARQHESHNQPAQAKFYRDLIPLTRPQPGEQYAFEVDLDKCSGCKACVTACHSLNGLDDDETWRNVGLLISPEDALRAGSPSAFHQHVTTACHHCVDPGCLSGCPVLAYDKDPVTGIVRHLDDQCIGCQYCVMKCPYEVPKYSPRRGIVRKCDMCSSRLAVGEAPACVQACPSEAILITLVHRAEVSARFRNAGGFAGTDEAPVSSAASAGLKFSVPNCFLPDAPDPRLTLPTTRYLSKQLRPELIAADHTALRLDQPHWPLVIMLVLTQAAAGLFLAHAALELAGVAAGGLPVGLTGFILLCAGLTAAAFHLGQPTKAWRCFLGWRRSWLSREIIVFNAVAGAAAAAVLAPWVPLLAGWESPLVFAAGGLGFLGVFASAMVYVDTGRPFWNARVTFENFFGTALLLGATFATVVLGWTDHRTGIDLTRATQFAAITATLIRTALFARRQLQFRSALHNPDSPVHLNARVIQELRPWTQPARGLLFVVSTGFSVLAIANIGSAAPWWASFAALATLSSEIIARHLFFTASGSKRMPGGVAA